MLYIKPVWIGILFTYFLHRHLITFVNGGSNTKAAAPYYLSDVAIDCGATVGNSTALDGREWVGEAASKFVSGKPRSSTAVDKSFLGVDPVPYMTSRISATPFHYTFPVNPGQKFIRLHFYPASYRGFEKSTDFFSVRAGPFTLLRDYSASLTADALGVKYLVKEFCLNVEENELLKITFSPSQSSSKSKTNTYAFVNGIEIISMPSGLYYTPDGDLGAPIVGQHNRFYSIDNSTALELIQRLNIGGSSISPIEDFGMFRRWNEDTSYLLEARAHRVNHPVLKIKYTNMPAFIAPAKIYQTSWKSGRRIGVKQMYNFTWKVSVDLRFRYLVRLHFCELGSGMAEREPREFSVFINNQIAEINADVFRWSGDIGIPVYRDYILITKGGREGSKSDLLIGLQSVNELVFGLLNGLEIFKLSNLENSLAAPSLVFPNRVSSSRNLKIETFLSAFGQSNVIGTAMTVLIILLSIVTYNLRKFWEENNFHDEIVAQSDSVEPSYRCFTLAEIKLATENFSNAFVIGRGGFGKVYKGFIHGVSDAVAIKRLSSYSRQGAREFWTEIEMLSNLRHIHLVSLVGYCNECQEMILVYEYIAGGTLADNLYKFARKGKDCAPLSWEQRLKICIGAARGLEYLHTGSEYGVIHRDVKDTNILLDENFVAKISDFGLSKLEKMTQSKNYVSTKVKGTVGYLDPDYFITHRLTRKSDVYAFGVMLLVVLSGRPALDASNPGETQSLLSCFRECLAEDDVNKIVDPCLRGEISPNRLREFVKSIENCLHQLPKKRPTMAQVVAILEQALEQHGSSISAASADATVVDHPLEEGAMQSFQLSHHKVPILEEGVISPPKEGVTSKQTQNLASPTVEKDLHLRGNDYTPVRKPVLGWTWKSFWSKVTKQKVVESIFEEQPLYGYKTLAIATRNFATENNLGVGAFGAVYKGILSNGQEIAVRRLSIPSNLGNMEFRNEVEVMSKLQHNNLVGLLGCCVERNDKVLIYEYIPNGNLDTYLFGSKKQDLLDWNRRTSIIEGIARGLLYLHRDSKCRVIHRDVKASNILLDKDLNPKISGFGLARIYQSNYEQTSVIAGTYGYMAPEYALKGLISEKLDVYSYGVLLLEIISGRKNSEFFRDDNYNYGGLTDLAWKLWNENETIKLVDPAILCPGIEMEILRYVHVGLLCIEESAKDRPDVPTLLSMLKNEISELPQPKSPAYTEDSVNDSNFMEVSSSAADSQSFLQQSGDCVNDVDSTNFDGR